jgi:hypothetical protein
MKEQTLTANQNDIPEQTGALEIEQLDDFDLGVVSGAGGPSMGTDETRRAALEEMFRNKEANRHK